MRRRLPAMLLLMLAASQARADAPAPPPAPASAGKRIFQPPLLRWDSSLLGYRPAMRQTPADFANLTGGIAFGMSPSALNAHLAEPAPNLSWSSLNLANEYPGEARFFRIPIGTAGVLRMGMTACTGNGSYLVFLFNTNGLFRMSYRLVADRACPDTNEAAQQIFARYVPLGRGIALSVRYRTGKAQVVDITDPAADYLTPIRWHQGGT